jgi:glyoxylase-like metal-dependent hydrolase (beta-lactamase superfamily II)
MADTHKPFGDIVAIDTEMAGMTHLLAGFLVPGPRPAVIETGPATVVPKLVEGLRELGLGPDDVATFVISHIHLDHGGGAGDILEHFPNAEIVVHRAGAPHMADPSKLMKSAYRVFGENLDRLFGPLKPVPQDNLRAVDPGDFVDLGGGRTLEIVEAPGHAKHHLAVLDSDTGALFVGDSMGVYLPEADLLRPATPPPDFNLDEALATLDRYRERNPQALLLSHYGLAPTDRDMLNEAEEKLRRYGEIIRTGMQKTEDLDQLTAILEKATWDEYAEVREEPELMAKFEALNAFRSSAAGYLRYFQTHH